MLTLLSDENFSGDILRGLLDRIPEIDLVRVQDVELPGAKDPEILEWAAAELRVILTHDRRTFPGFAYDSGLAMPGVIVVSDQISAGQAIDELTLLRGWRLQPASAVYPPVDGFSFPRSASRVGERNPRRRASKRA